MFWSISTLLRNQISEKQIYMDGFIISMYTVGPVALLCYQNKLKHIYCYI